MLCQNGQENNNDRSSSDGMEEEDEDWAPEPAEEINAAIGKLIITKVWLLAPLFDV